MMSHPTRKKKLKVKKNVSAIPITNWTQKFGAENPNSTFFGFGQIS